MNKLSIVTLLILLTLGCTSKNNSTETKVSESIEKSTNPSAKKYQIESGIISYKMDMMGMETKMTVYFKEFGKIEASYTETEMMAEKTVIQTLQKDGYYYTFTPAKNTGTKFQMNGDKIMDESGMHKMNESDILNMGGKKIGTEKILGKECSIYQLSDDGIETKVWIWNNMFLKTISSQNGIDMKTEAYEVKETSNFPAGIFDVPKNIKFSEPTINPESDKDFENKDAKG